MRYVVLSLCLSLALSAAVYAGDEDWPQYRGPGRDGVVMDARLPQKWPVTFPAPKWRTFVGIGYSGPVIAGGKAFIQGREEDTNETCVALDADTGKVLWKRSYPSSFVPPDPTAGKGPNSTPTVDKDRVYMLGLGGMFHCLEVKTGKTLWKHDLAEEYWGVVKDETGDEAWRPPCGASASALAVGNTVVLPVGGAKAGAFTGFDRKTGAILWKALDDRSSYASPLLATVAGTRQFVGFTGKRMTGIDAEKHTLLWEFPFKAGFEQTIITPVLWKDHVIVSGEAKPTVALKIEKSADGLTQKTAWTNPDLSAYLVTPVIFKDHLLGFDQRAKRLVCVELATGKTAWTSPRLGKIALSLIVAGDKILALSDTGKLHLLAADPATYKPLGEWQIAEPGTVWSYLALAGNRLYVKDKEHLACYEL